MGFQHLIWQENLHDIWVTFKNDILNWHLSTLPTICPSSFLWTHTKPDYALWPVATWQMVSLQAMLAFLTRHPVNKLQFFSFCIKSQRELNKIFQTLWFSESSLPTMALFTLAAKDGQGPAFSCVYRTSGEWWVWTMVSITHAGLPCLEKWHINP